LTERVPEFDRSTAYAVQSAGLAMRLDAGERIIGGKLGFTSKAMQKAMGVPSPNYGWLTDAMVRTGVVSLAELIHPKVEPEVAFRLGSDLDDADTAASDVLAATTGVAPCLEIVDSRFTDFKFGPLDNIADNSSAGQIVIGDWTDLPTARLDLVGVVVTVDGEVAASAAGAAALDHPAEAVAWMARAVAGSQRPLKSGDVVISGGLTSPIDLTQDQVVHLEIDRVGACEFKVRS
jgi:2-keto-4-pentenoate hydratase